MMEIQQGPGQQLLVELTADIVAAYVSHHVVPVGDLTNLIADIHQALSNISALLIAPLQPPPKLVWCNWCRGYNIAMSTIAALCC